MITRLRIKGYKSLEDIELTDLSRLIVLFGPNAAGKSNLLDALDLLSFLAKEDTLIMAFQRHRGNRTNNPLPVRWFFHGAQENDHRERKIEVEVDLELQERIVEQLNHELEQREEHSGLERAYTRVTQPRLRYQLTIAYSPEARSLYVTHESLVPLTKQGKPHETIVPYIKHDKRSKR
ncbi:MAG: AAA family ATPase, partial [Halobacteriales archaeon]|nr:AAA family ATPase [Halobacteriales archaeon]